MSARPPAVPRGTGPRGRKLWASVVNEWHLDEHELVTLREMVRCVDALEALDALVAAEGLIVVGLHGQKIHPAAVEARQLRIIYARLDAALRLPDGEEGGTGTQGRRQRRVGARGTYGLRAVQ